MGDLINIAITNFKYRYATHILNNQDRLNKDKNAFINSSELKAILQEFGKTDFTELLKVGNEKFDASVFEQNQNGEKLINIMLFQDDIAKAILNNQDKFNPDYDSYINEKELQEVLKNFGVENVSSLLKPQKPSEQITSDNIQAAVVSTDDEEEVPIQQFTDDETDALNNLGSAAHEMDSKINADLALSSINTPYSQQMDALQKAKLLCEKRGLDSSTIDSQIDALRDMTENYLRHNKEVINPINTIVKQISYGQDGNKKALLSQSFGLTGNHARKIKDDNNEVESNDDTEVTENNDNGNNTDAEISYSIEFKTLNPINKGNWHIKGLVNAGSDNSDIHAVLAYNKKYNNGGVLNFSGNIQQTIENKNNVGNYGASLDYQRKKFSTGVYGMYSSKEIDGETTKNRIAEIHGKYGKTFREAVGVEKDDNSTYYYTKTALQGKHNFPTNNLAIHGGIEAEYGITKINDANLTSDPKNIILTARGGVAFKSNSFDANVSANISTRKAKFSVDDNDISMRATSASLIGNVSTKDFDFSTTISAINAPVDDDSGDKVFEMKNKTSVTTSIMIGIKKLFGKNVMPILRYNVGNYDGANQNFNVGVILTP